MTRRRMTDTELQRLISSELQELCATLERAFEIKFGEPVGFALLLTPYAPREALLQYVSNVSRDQTREMFRALVEKWDAGLPDIPAGVRQ